MQLSTTVERAKDQISCEVDGEVVILNLNSTSYFGLDEVGAYIWDWLSEPRTVGEICKAVLDHFDVDEATCKIDVTDLLVGLEQAGLIVQPPLDRKRVGHPT